MEDKLKVFLVDDEPLALKRLSRMLVKTGKVEIIGQTTEPLEALKLIPNLNIDAIFLDIQMPELTGFELLQKLDQYSRVIFTTAFDEFALKAFEVNSIDYLLKPIETERLEKAVDKLKRSIAEPKEESTARLEALLQNLAIPDTENMARPLEKIASRVGGKVQILDVLSVTHFFAQDKITLAKNAEGREFPLDDSLNYLEERLDSAKFVRVHRATIVNLDFIDEVHGWFSGKVLIRLKDDEKTELIVARDRVKVLKEFLGM